MIKLITGVPGSGKTQYAIKQAIDSKRAVRFANIPLTIGKVPEGWEPIEPPDWQKAAAGSLIIIDEAQDYMMASQKEPAAWVRDLAKHRHHGVDIWLITQDPKQIHAYVRRLVGEWANVVRVFGQNAANIEIRVGVDEKKPALETKLWAYDKEIWNLYHSATLHTKHGRVPIRLVAGIILVALVGTAAVWGLTKSGVTNTKQNWVASPPGDGEAAKRAIEQNKQDRANAPKVRPDLSNMTAKDPKNIPPREITGEGIIVEKTCPVLVGVVHSETQNKTVAVFRSADGASYMQTLPKELFFGDVFSLKNCEYYIASGSLYTRDADARNQIARSEPRNVRPDNPFDRSYEVQTENGPALVLGRSDAQRAGMLRESVRERIAAGASR